MSVDLIRNRPVFDKEILKPGIAIKYRNKDCLGKWSEWSHALATRVTLEYIEATICPYENQEEALEIDINDIVEDLYQIQLLK